MKAETTWHWGRSGLKQASIHGADAADPTYFTERVRSCAFEDLEWPWQQTFNKLPAEKRVDTARASRRYLLITLAHTFGP